MVRVILHNYNLVLGGVILLMLLVMVLMMVTTVLSVLCFSVLGGGSLHGTPTRVLLLGDALEPINVRQQVV